MFRKPATWIVLILISTCGLLFALRFFSQAFPIVSLDLRMDRTDAIQRASELAKERSIGPASFKQAASFGSDSAVQTYVELEAGGVDAFRKLIEGGLYSPYQWEVRHFKEGEKHEASFFFTPEGKSYGFSESLPEDEPGASLSTEEARKIAESSSAAWGVSLDQYNLVEWPADTKPGGRTDHTFVYQRPDQKLGDAEYRLSLVVSGDRLTGVQHFMKIPEAFSRKYQEMRSSNDTIAFGATVAMGILYIIGGCVIGLFFLLRQRAVIWRPALMWGCIIGGLQFLGSVNELPLLWMGYDTALSAGSFLARQLVMAAGGALAMGGVLTVTFMAAEGLTRKAFPEGFQFWRLWSPGVANSKPILGRTLAGYLLVSVFFAYDVALYTFSNRALGWWSPSEALIHPDTLATYFPWLNSIATSLQAGFWEECLFRAVPLAGAALLGKRFGKRGLWIGGALILEAVIFGAAHANYPAQPAYARLVELIIPALGFGGIYLLFGLLPGIILHFTFDVVWFALPIFVSTSSGVWIDKVLVVVLTLTPLWVVLYFRTRRGRWEEPGRDTHNQAWVPAPQAVEDEEEVPLAESRPATRLPRWLIYGLGLVGLVSWGMLSRFGSDVPTMKIFRTEAVHIADSTLEQRGIQLGSEWTRLSTIDVPLNENDLFVWQEGGAEAYRELMGTYLGPPYWRVRYVRFEGDVADRAEEYQVHIDPSGKVFRVLHILPEATEGAQLDEDQAKEMADETLQAEFGINPSNVKLVAREPTQQPDRRDWSFTYSDSAHYPLQKGEARIYIQISGDQVTDAYRFVFVPDEWLRQERADRSTLDLIQMVSGALIAILVFAGAILALVNWTRHRFVPRSFLIIFGALVLFSWLSRANAVPTFLAGFSTAQPFSLQLTVLVLALILGSLFVAAGTALVYGLVKYWKAVEGPSAREIGVGIAAGLFVAGFAAVASATVPQLAPKWGDPSPAADFFPFLGVLLQAVSGLVSQVVIALFLVTALNRISSFGRRRLPMAASALVLFGFSIAGSRGIEGLGSWIVSAVILTVIFALVYWFVFRTNSSAVIPAVLVLNLAGLGKAILQDPFTGIIPAGIAAAALIILVGFFWWSRIGKVSN